MTRIILLALLLPGCGGADSDARKTEPAPDSGPAPVACLPYGPDTVTITGRLEQAMFYGPPNFGEEPETDEEQWHFYVVPDSPLCTRPGADAYEEPQRDVRLVQMVLDSAGYARSRPYLNRRVRATGTLSGQHTGHHHAPILLQVHEIIPADGAR